MDGLVAVYARPFGRQGASVKASSGGGRWLQWGRPGELYCWNSFTRRMIRVRHHAEGGRRVSDGADLLWTAAGGPVEVPLTEHLGFGFDLDPARGRFLMMESAAAAAHPVAPEVVLALGWGDALEARRP